MSDAGKESSILSKTVFSACGDRRQIKVKDSEESFLRASRASRTSVFAQRSVSGYKARRGEHLSTVTCSRRRSTSASLVR